MKSLRVGEAIGFGLFGIAFSAAWIAGSHIHVDFPDDYTSGIEHNYLTPLTVSDGIFFVVISVLVACIAFFVYRFATSKTQLREPDVGPIPWRVVAIIAVIMFLCWLPYLLLYWPGIVLGDSLNSIEQSLGEAPLSNHHPVLYTLFIKTCLNAGMALGDATLGIALYCIVQMVVMSVCLSYLLCWVRKRMRVHVAILAVMLVLFSLAPYYATYSVALWKDPVFSCAVVMLSILLGDLVISDGAVAKSRSWIVALFAISLLVVFTRNNGVFLVAFCCLSCLAVYLKKKSGGRYLRCCCVLGLVTLIGAATIPVYSFLGMSGRMAEAGGVPLSQMANVVVHDGNMSDSDRDWLNQLMPLDEYEKYYSPRIVDTFKNSESFAGMDGGVVTHWPSLLVRNPDLFVEAWVLETYGFWTVNRPEIWCYDENVMRGQIWNFPEAHAKWLSDRGIYAANLMGDDGLRNVFSLQCLQLPIGVIFWLVVYLAICLVLSGRKRLVIALVPTFALLGTLFIAVPLFYWPRYALAVQLLIPFYIGMVRLHCASARKGLHAR